jgi:hypothetical protein
MKTEITEAVARIEVMKLLKETPTGHTDMMMSRKMKYGLPSLRLVLENMVNDKLIRKEPLGKCRRYYIPSDRELAAESAAKPIMRPLAPRPQHKAIIERIMGERMAIPSIG